MTEDERTALASIEVKIDELIKWKDTVHDLLYGTLKGEFGYFHKANILWRIIFLWPVLLLSIGFGATMSFIIQHFLNHPK